MVVPTSDKTKSNSYMWASNDYDKKQNVEDIWQPASIV